MRFASLASGSRGNALLVEFGDTLLMIDCGLTLRDVEERLGALGRCPADVAGVLVTHEHHDHLRGVAPFARRHDVPVWMTPGTARAADGFGEVNVLSSHRPFRIGGIAVEPFPVPHDAREPCQFVLRAGGRRLGVLTDTGHVTLHIRERLSRCHALALECNHDAEELARSSYPPSVKMRVASPYGHLNNAQAAALVESCVHAELQWVVAMHVSERNNSPERVRGALAPALDPARIPLHVAEQDRVSGWLEIA
ncbi:MAG TPA: MBL fold metallo-hydrolase [Gammaproteobacteria bacterium]